MVNTPTSPDQETAEHAHRAMTQEATAAAAPTAPRRGPTLKKRLKQSLIATTVAGLLAGAALTIWIVNSRTEALILRVANYALSGMDGELSDIRLGPMGLEHWHIRSASLRVHDSYLVINNLDIQLELNWPKSLEELKQLVQVESLTQKIKRISTGEIDVELGASLLERSPTIADEQTPALALNIKSLPLIDIGKTTLRLAPQAELPAYQLVMDKLSLNHQAELTTAFSSPEGEPLAHLTATLGNEQWRLKSELNIAPLLENLHQIGLRQTQGSILSQLTLWDQQWQQLGIGLSGQLSSESTMTLATGEITSRHRIQQPGISLSHFADLTLAPQPALGFELSGSLASLNLTLEPFSLALTPNAAQHTQLLAALNHSQQLSDVDYQALLTLLSGLKSTEAPVGLAFSMTAPLHYALISQASPHKPIALPALELSTLDGKLETHIHLQDIQLTPTPDAWNVKSRWQLVLKQTTPLSLRELWRAAPQDFSWSTGMLQTAGHLSVDQSPQGLNWQISTAPVTSDSNVSSDTLQFALEDLQLQQTAQAAEHQTKQTQLSLGSIQLNAKAPMAASATPLATQDTTGAQSTEFAFKLPPLSLALSQLRVSQAVDNLTGNNSATTAIQSSRNDISLKAFSLETSKAMTLDYTSLQSIESAIQSSQLSNQVNWQAQQLLIEKQLSAKGRTRKQTVLKLDNLALTQTLNWQNQRLHGHEQWQVGTVELQSDHQLQFAAPHKPLLLTGQWVVDTSMTEALSLLNQTQPLPTELNVTGHNQLQAQFKLTHEPEQTQFAMQITQSMTELEGFYQDTTFEGGKLQAQCEFTWGQSYKAPQALGYFSSLSRLNCPQTVMTFNLFDPGFPLTDIEVEADIVLAKDAEKLPDNWLQQLTGLSDTDVSMTAKGKVLSGQFLLPDFNLKLQDKSHAYLLLQGMSLEEVLRIQPQMGIYADGIFDGVLPVDLVDGKVSISGGQLAARAPGGLIAISGNPAVDQMRQSQPYLDFVFSALEHLEYSQLSSSFDMDQTGDANLLVEVKGRSRGIERPIHLNYSHEENMLQLFRSLQIGNDLQDRIEKSVK
ncbi:C4-dicarboxylate ABC transporter [Shewanella sp. BC20]|uniref:YdbH domain-containing protein n=1 Tax=Shewanella sp. BC20 TaxID=2004459 RepID=UPI000D6549B7|nr:YdbH domain-containing protein [Shewanella sp. BC20]PWF64441.1 C4-dicarboxylate ABC transporter [Shewanella sp. BC20]